MESLPVDVLQSILCRVPLRDVLMLKAASPEFHKLVRRRRHRSWRGVCIGTPEGRRLRPGLDAKAPMKETTVTCYSCWIRTEEWFTMTSCRCSEARAGSSQHARASCLCPSRRITRRRSNARNGRDYSSSISQSLLGELGGDSAAAEALCIIKLPPGRGDHYYARERWMLCGCDGHMTLVYNEDFIRTGEGWKLDEAALNQKSSPPYAQKCGESSIECWDGNYWKECDEKTAAVLKLVNDIHKKEEVESTYWSNELNLDQGSNHIGFTCAWKDSPDDRLRVYNAKGEVVNRLTASYLHSVLDIPPMIWLMI